MSNNNRSSTIDRTDSDLKIELDMARQGLPDENSRAVATRGKAKPKQESVRIELPKLKLEDARVTLVGDSPLIVHAWSQKAKELMLAKQMKKAKQAKEAKDPWVDFLDSLYWLSPRPKTIPVGASLKKFKFGFPSIGFKASAVGACSHIDGVTKVEARGAFHIPGEFVEISGTPTMREDMVRVGMGTADLRYRGEFKEWSVELPIRYNVNVLSLEQIVNLFNTAGFGIGVGEWRPEKDGSFGMFHAE